MIVVTPPNRIILPDSPVMKNEVQFIENNVFIEIVKSWKTIPWVRRLEEPGEMSAHVKLECWIKMELLGGSRP